GAHIVHSGEAETLQSMVDGLALWVEDAVLKGDEHARFHGFIQVSFGPQAAMASASDNSKFHPLFTLFGDNGQVPVSCSPAWEELAWPLVSQLPCLSRWSAGAENISAGAIRT